MPLRLAKIPIGSRPVLCLKLRELDRRVLGKDFGIYTNSKRKNVSML